MAQGSQGPRSCSFSAQSGRPTSKLKPGEIHWAIRRRNLDGSRLCYYVSNAPENTILKMLACVGGFRWRIETEFETEKGDKGLDEYETRSWTVWHNHIAMCLLAGAFLLNLQLVSSRNRAVDRLANASYQIVIEGAIYREKLSPHRRLLADRGSD